MEKIWFNRLNGGKNCLCNFYDKEIVYNGFIVALQDKEKKYLFCLFRNLAEYYEYYLKLNDENRTMFETIIGNKLQKPKFDIDINLKELQIDPNDWLNFGQNVLNFFIQSLLINMPELNLNKDVIICTSHNLDKISYHVILPFYHHINNMQAKSFYDKVILDIPEVYRKYIDHSVYKSVQQFRLLGNKKPNTNRIKIFNKSWTYGDQIINYEYPEVYKNIIDKTNDELLVQFLLSTISFILPESKPMQNFEVKINDKVQTKFKGDVRVDKVYDLLINFFSQINNKRLTHIDQLPFRIEGNKDNMILLRRTRPSLCLLCNRVHQHQNPYLIIFGLNGAVYYNCRRNENNKSLFLGYLDPYNTSEIDIEFQKENETKEDEIISVQNLEQPQEDIFNKLKKITPIKETKVDKKENLCEIVDKLQNNFKKMM